MGEYCSSVVLASLFRDELRFTYTTIPQLYALNVVYQVLVFFLPSF